MSETKSVKTSALRAAEGSLGKLELVSKAVTQAEERGQDLERSWGVVGNVMRLARSWWRREYREVPWRTLGLLVVAVLYLLNPFDLIPDPIPILGVLDDATVFAFVLASFRGDLRKFGVWEQRERNLLAAPEPVAAATDGQLEESG